MFNRGRELAAAAGLTLVDTKYEFGFDEDGRVTLIDEIHTPDSSRYWRAGTTEPMDKEIVRLWYATAGYRGDGDPPPLPAELADRLSLSYRTVYEQLTGQRFAPGTEPAEDRIAMNLGRWMAGSP